MRPHGGVLLLLCLAACLAGIGVVVLGFGSETAAAVIPDEPEVGPADPGRGTPIEAPTQPADLTPREGVFRRQEPVAVIEAGRPKRQHGLIRGDVTLTAGTLDKIDAITIRVVEAVRGPGNGGQPPFTYQHTLRFDPKEGTPSFALDEIPFSRVGYVVQAFVAGLNGTEQVVQLTEDNPVADVVLGVHPGTPFSVLLRDQNMAVLADVEVTLTPEGHPAGRQAYYKKTDSFGAAVFPDVLRGTYQAHVGPMGQTLLPPQPVEVLASSGTQAQSTTIVVPKGESLTVNLFTATGHGATDVEVKLSSGSDVRYREVKQKTDWSGRTTFEHLTPGSYWINVLDPRYEPRTVPAAIRAGEKPKDVDVRLLMR